MREDEARWLAFARRVPTRVLEREVRAVDRGSVEGGCEPGQRAPQRRAAVEEEDETRVRIFDGRRRGAWPQRERRSGGRSNW